MREPCTIKESMYCAKCGSRNVMEVIVKGYDTYSGKPSYRAKIYCPVLRWWHITDHGHTNDGVYNYTPPAKQTKTKGTFGTPQASLEKALKAKL